MVLLFLRDWRSVVVVALNIPFALCGAVVALWLADQTVNLMTLGGLSLAVGILVDEATVEVENIHAKIGHGSSIARAVRQGNLDTAVPRLLAMRCVLAVFLPSFFMQGPARSLFVPLSLAVGFAMIASYLLSSTFVPVLSTWLLRHQGHAQGRERGRSAFDRFHDLYGRGLGPVVRLKRLVVPAYLAGAILVTIGVGGQLGLEIFPRADAGRFRLRLKAPTGTRIEKTGRIAIAALGAITREVGKDAVGISVGCVGMIPSSYPINAVDQWTGGPSLLLRDVAKVRRGTMPGEYDRYNMKRSLGLTANIVGEDPGRVATRVSKAIEQAGRPHKGVIVDVRGQVAAMWEMLTGLSRPGPWRSPVGLDERGRSSGRPRRGRV